MPTTFSSVAPVCDQGGTWQARRGGEPVVSVIQAGGFVELPVRALHAARVRDLPDIHRDPFDRLLVAQALSEPLGWRLLTAT